MNVYLVQSDIHWENRAANHASVTAMLSLAPPLPGSLVVLPEMFSTGFSMRLEATAQTSQYEDEKFLSALAQSIKCTVVAGVVSPVEDGKSFNECVAFGPEGDLLTRYAKIQPFMTSGEGECIRAGNDVTTFAWNGFTVAPFVCYDLRFPEHFRKAVKEGANLMIVIASWPARRHHHWLTLLKARAIENLAYVIGVNRVGSDPNASYCGRSIVVSPHGHIIADAGENEQVLATTIDLEDVLKWRSDFPALHDMRE